MQRETVLSLVAVGAMALPRPSGEGLYFSGASASLAIAFPRYRAFLYNTTNRSAAVDVLAYLRN